MIGRPKKIRKVGKEPNTKQFSPRGHRGRPGYNELKIEEIEAIRLIDHMGLKQAEAAESMGISQQTFSRVLRNARKSLGEALVLGRIIKIKGGVFKIAVFTALLILAAVSISGCASIPIPSSIPLPNNIPILSMFI